ncbi:MAG: hypothetical protein WDW38_007580 [Sanguina aurantia]
MIDIICDYLSDVESQRVRPDVLPGYLSATLPSEAPELPQPFADVVADVKGKIIPGVVHWQHPSFFAYFGANVSAPAMLADMWSSAINMIGFSWAAAPVSTELEMVMMDWLARLCGLPARFLFASGGPGGGVIQGTSSEAVLVALLAARAAAMKDRPVADRLKLVAYSSDQAHSGFKKACMIAGVDLVRLLPTSAADEYALQPGALSAAMAADLGAGLIPFYVCGTIGTTSSCAVDPVGDMALVAHRFKAWMHVDAAYAGSASMCPEQRHFFTGLEHVDSYSFNPHKWMLTNFDCCACWFADAGPLKEALSLTPVYLRGLGNALDYKDWQIPLGRKFRSLKLYFVLRQYGAESLREYLRHHMALAQWFGERVREDARFQLVAPVRFGLVCFRLTGATNKVNASLLDAINKDGSMFLIATELSSQHTIRLAIGSTSTQLRHVRQAWLAIQKHATAVLSETAAVL